ncbi:hypothetical protein D9613_002739 [Agrocybe pediades]|uniref:DNA-binding protein RAP1 n=1 Tax=Agrocybe pediades TaxID=84607 RepID=A0A8H4QS45_9AGAR|nr:hypothetical protein D9613_002739 [Agrocybe pediades]
MATSKLFRDEHDLPIKFYIHPDVRKDDTRKVLTQDIKRHGGRVTQRKEDANTIIVPVGQANKFRAAYTYAASTHSRPEVYVEEVTFIGHCMANRRVFHRIPEPKGMPGPRSGSRVPYTASDDENLCQYIAAVLPEKEAGGRMGQGLYDTLCAIAKSEPDEFAWASRHPAQSWRERYKKNMAKFDARIDAIVASSDIRRTNLSGKDRRAHAGGKQFRDDDDFDEEGDEELGPSPPPPPRRSSRQKGSDDENDDSEEEDAPPSPPRVASNSPARVPANKRRRVQLSQDRTSEVRKGKQRAIEDIESDNAELSEGHSLFSDIYQDMGIEDTYDGPNAPEPFSPFESTFVQPGTSTSKYMPPPIQSSPNHASPSSSKVAIPQHQPRLLQSTPLLSSSPRTARSDQDRTQQAAAHVLSNSVPSTSHERPKKAARRPRVVPNSPVQLVHVGDIIISSEENSMDPVEDALPSPESMSADEPDVFDIPSEREAHFNGSEPPPVQRDSEESDEEEDVVDLITIGQTRPRASQNTNTRRVFLETDDAQIVNSLGRPSQAQGRALTSFGLQELKEDEEYEEGESLTSPYSRSFLMKSSPAAPVSPPLASGSLRMSLPFVLNSQDPRTPGQFTRASSFSSNSSISSGYPVKGTKARALRKSMTQTAKEMPYTPPDGTRAAQMLARR